MCGIIAVQGEKIQRISQEASEKMIACLTSRGPDDAGTMHFDTAILGQTRLSIIDLSPAGHQPMQDAAHKTTITFNGEVYNYKELRTELEKKGHVFSSESDTEVILKTYAEYGHECPKYLEGMFAFAIWDEARDELFIARDRFGKKPFYFTFIDGLFIGASEIKAIFESGLVSGHISTTALDEYLTFGYILPNKTIYSNIQTLLPAHSGVVKNGTLQTQEYWRLEKKQSTASYDEAKETIRHLLNEAVRKRMIADVEIGSLLSGGVDSTLVTEVAQTYASNPIKTFSIGYEGAYSELPFAQEASKYIGTEHHTKSVSVDSITELERIIAYMDEPHGDTSNFPQHLISEFAGSKVKVILTGDGADELFMGYGWYQKKWHMPRWRLDWRLRNPFAVYRKTITLFSKNSRRKLLRTKVPSDKKYFSSVLGTLKDALHKINICDLRIYLPAQLLTKIDRTSMMHSVEVRSPFLDTALVEYVYNLPTSFKMSKTQSKIILKDILTESFSKEFVYRRKQGFGAPLAEWLQNPVLQKLIETTFQDSNPMFTHLQRKYVLEVKREYDAGTRGADYKLWILLCLGIWFNSHKRHHAS